jgi:hypothetical protein
MHFCPSWGSLRRLVVRADRLWGGLDGLVTRKGGDKRYMVYVLKQLRISGIQLPWA